MNGVVLVPEILDRVNAEALLPKETDRRLQDLVVAWLLTCGGAETRKAYGADFREFGAFVEKMFGRIAWDGLTGMGASAYVAWLKGRLENREIAPSTVARKIASVSAFFEYCAGQNELPRNPLAKVKRPPKQPKSEVLSDDEVFKLKELLSAERIAAEQGKLLASIRAARFNEVVFNVMMGTGCRISELLALRLRDVEIRGDQGRLHFRTKGAEDHIVSVPRALAESVIEFARFVGIQSDTENVFLFKNTKESAEKKIGRELIRLCKLAGIEKDVTPHVLRATVATSLHEKGVPIVHIQRLLNHKDISTTAVYIRNLEIFDR